MTDSNATELRRLLEERGIEYRTVEVHGMLVTLFEHDRFTWSVTDHPDGYMIANCGGLTPEQAVAATLGAGECEVVMSSTDGLCTDNPKHWFKLSCGHSFTVDGLEKPVACAVCGKEVKR